MKEKRRKCLVSEVSLLPVVSFWDNRMRDGLPEYGSIPLNTLGAAITFDSGSNMYVYTLMLSNELMYAMAYVSSPADYKITTRTLAIISDISISDICSLCDSATCTVVEDIKNSGYIDNRQFSMQQNDHINKLFNNLVESVYMSIFATLTIQKSKTDSSMYPMSPFIGRNDKLYLDMLVTDNESTSAYKRSIVWQSDHPTEFQKEMKHLSDTNNVMNHLSEFMVSNYKLVMWHQVFIIDRILVVLSGNTMSSAIIPSRDDSPMVFKLLKIK